MKKKTNTAPNRARRVITAGILVLLATPLIQPLFFAITQSGCPLYDGRRECGFDPGLRIAFYGELLLPVWLLIGAILLFVGIIQRNNLKKKV